MDNTLIKILTGIGLNEKEAKVYLACIETGSAPVSKIATAAGINRVTTYDVLEKLKQKGMVGFITKAKIKYFNCIKPEIVLEEYERKTNDLRTALPKFQRLTGDTSHPRIRYFEGIEGIKGIYADTLTSSTEILNFSNSDEIRRNWPKYDEEYVEKRANKNIYLRGICPKDNAGIVVHSEDKKYYRELRLLKKDQFNFTNEINIYDDKVAIISFKDELIGMIIESTEIANSQRAIFDICWQFAEIIENGDSARTKMLEPLTEAELEKSISDSNKERQQKKINSNKNNARTENKEAQPENNLSLF